MNLWSAGANLKRKNHPRGFSVAWKILVDFAHQNIWHWKKFSSLCAFFIKTAVGDGGCGRITSQRRKQKKSFPLTCKSIRKRDWVDRCVVEGIITESLTILTWLVESSLSNQTINLRSQQKPRIFRYSPLVLFAFLLASCLCVILGS